LRDAEEQTRSDTLPREQEAGMKDVEVTMDHVQRVAAEIGLDRLTPEHMQAFLRAAKVAHARRASLKTGTLGPADEPAHVYRLTEGGR
jgi:hypothetical protein